MFFLWVKPRQKSFALDGAEGTPPVFIFLEDCSGYLNFIKTFVFIYVEFGAAQNANRKLEQKYYSRRNSGNVQQKVQGLI